MILAFYKMKDIPPDLTKTKQKKFQKTSEKGTIQVLYAALPALTVAARRHARRSCPCTAALTAGSHLITAIWSPAHGVGSTEGEHGLVLLVGLVARHSVGPLIVFLTFRQRSRGFWWGTPAKVIVE